MSVRICWGSGGNYPLPLLLAWWLLVLLLLPPRVEAKQYLKEANDKEILDYLLHKANYDKRIRPYENEHVLKVNVSVLLLSLSSPDESSLKYEIEFHLHTRWIDPRLVHDDGNRYQYLSGMHHINEIWLPDIIFIKHGDFKEPDGPHHVALKIYRNGTIIYSRRRHLVLTCKGDLNVFPFDDPSCQFSLESVSYENHDIIFDWNDDAASDFGKILNRPDTLSELNTYLVQNATKDCEPEKRDFWRGLDAGKLETKKNPKRLNTK